MASVDTGLPIGGFGACWGRRAVTGDFFTSDACRTKDRIIQTSELVTKAQGKVVSAAGEVKDRGNAVARSVRSSPARTSAGVKNQLGLELFQLQADQGPCLDCYAIGDPVSVANLHADAARWPQFVRAATAAWPSVADPARAAQCRAASATDHADTRLVSWRVQCRSVVIASTKGAAIVAAFGPVTTPGWVSGSPTPIAVRTRVSPSAVAAMDL
jgi:hypothetical protein